MKDGTLDCIATDHAPHAYHEKEQEFDRAPFGIIGLETALPLAITVLHKHFALPLPRIVQFLSTNPARLFQFMHRGTLVVGAYADVTIFDPKMTWKYQAATGLFEITEHTLRWLDAYGESDCDDGRRESLLTWPEELWGTPL